MNVWPTSSVCRRHVYPRSRLLRRFVAFFQPVFVVVKEGEATPRLQDRVIDCKASRVALARMLEEAARAREADQ